MSSSGAVSSATSSRGHLLREVARLSDEILTTNVKFTDVSSRLQRELEKIARLQKELKEADDDLKAVVAQKKYESENDTELSSLQRVVAALTLKRMELIRQTKAARAERERLKEAVRGAYYSRIGAAAEVAMVAASTGLLSPKPDSPADRTDSEAPLREQLLAPLGLTNITAAAAGGWSPLLVALWQDAEALWKRVSTLSETTRDIVEGAMALRGLRLTSDPAVARCPFDATTNPPASSSADGEGDSAADEGLAPRGVGAALAAGAAAAAAAAARRNNQGVVNLSVDSVDFEASAAGAPVYGALGEEHVLNDAKKAVASVASFEADWRRLQTRVEEVKEELAAVMMGDCGDVLVSQDGALSPPQLLALNHPFAGNVAAAEAIATTLTGIRQSLELQRMLLRAIVGGSAAEEEEDVGGEHIEEHTDDHHHHLNASATAGAGGSGDDGDDEDIALEGEALASSANTTMVTANGGAGGVAGGAGGAGGIGTPSRSAIGTPKQPAGSPAASVSTPSRGNTHTSSNGAGDEGISRSVSGSNRAGNSSNQRPGGQWLIA